MKLFYDLLSQPSRALYILMRLSKIEFETCPVALRKGEHLSDEFKYNVSKFQKVPVLHHGDFKLTESIAILRYLAKEKSLSEQLYPSDNKQQARVDEYLEWQHNNTRAFCGMYFRMKWLMPILTGQETNPKKLAVHKGQMEEVLDVIERLWLDQSPYIAGESLTAADIFAASEIEQPRMTGYDPCEGRPLLSAWLEKVRKECDPHYGEAHAILNKISAKAVRDKKQ